MVVLIVMCMIVKPGTRPAIIFLFSEIIICVADIALKWCQ